MCNIYCRGTNVACNEFGIVQKAFHDMKNGISVQFSVGLSKVLIHSSKYILQVYHNELSMHILQTRLHQMLPLVALRMTGRANSGSKSLLYGGKAGL